MTVGRPPGHSPQRRAGLVWRIAAVASCAALFAPAGCATFDDSSSAPFTTAPQGNPPATTTPSPPPRKPRKPGPCVDPDENVVATCLDATGGLAVLPDGVTALVTERRTGAIKQVIAPQQKTVDFAKVDVDASGDGGLLGIALSPTFSEDKLIYLYLSTATDNRVVRLAPGGTPKPILTGIPKGPVDNGGGIAFSSPTQLLVLTGDAGSAGAANDPNSLAGKLLKIDNPSADGSSHAQVVMSGINAAGGVCPGANGVVWVTDRTPTQDRLQKITNGIPAPAPAWTWPDRPGVAGCAASADRIGVALRNSKAMAILTLEKDGSITTAPTIAVQDRYGVLNGAAIGPDGLVWVGTINKSEGKPGPNDDRVVLIKMAGGPGSGSPD